MLSLTLSSQLRIEDEPNKYNESSVIACKMSTTKTISFQAHNPPPSAEKVRKGLSYRALVKHTTSRYVLVLNCFFTKTENSWAIKKGDFYKRL